MVSVRQACCLANSKTMWKHLLSVNCYHQYFTDVILSRLRVLSIKLSHRLEVGKRSKFRGLPIISLSERSSIKLGSNAYLISRSINTALGVNHPVILRTVRPMARIYIGDYFRASGVSICAAEEIIIGSRVTMGANATIVDTDFHSENPAERSSLADGSAALTGRVRIGDDVFIGMNATILKGVTLGDGATIGACSVVVKDVPPLAVFCGNPARHVRDTRP